MTAVVLVLLSAGEAAAGPTDQLRQHVERILGILRNPAFQGEAKTRERRAAIREVATNLFHFDEMAKRSLGRHWRARTSVERAEFTELFASLLERAYIVRVEDYGGEPIRYRPGAIEGDRATVHTTIRTKGESEVPVDYRMLPDGNRWRVYDVIIEGVSLVANYRAQFNRIIRTSSWEELVERMKAKTAAQARATPGTRNLTAHRRRTMLRTFSSRPYRSLISNCKAGARISRLQEVRA